MRVHRFALISGLGWLTDLTILLTAVHFGVRPMAANILSAGAAVTLVFVLSQRTLFLESHHFLARKFGLYVLWNVVAITAASAAIAALAKVTGLWAEAIPLALSSSVRADVAVLAAKIAVTPLTMYANYLALTKIMEGQASWR